MALFGASDVKLATRALRPSPSFLVAVILIYAVAIGTTTSMFSSALAIFEELANTQSVRNSLGDSTVEDAGRMARPVPQRHLPRGSSRAARPCLRVWVHRAGAPPVPMAWQEQAAGSDPTDDVVAKRLAVVARGGWAIARALS